MVRVPGGVRAGSIGLAMLFGVLMSVVVTPLPARASGEVWDFHLNYTVGPNWHPPACGTGVNGFSWAFRASVNTTLKANPTHLRVRTEWNVSDGFNGYNTNSQTANVSVSGSGEYISGSYYSCYSSSTTTTAALVSVQLFVNNDTTPLVLAIGGASEMVPGHVTSVGATGPAGVPTAEEVLPYGGFPPEGDVADPAVSCTRVLSQNAGNNVGTFDGTVESDVNAVDTYEWDWGDGATAGTALDGQHVYPAVGSMPTGGWTATVTVSRTPNTGHAFSDDTTAPKEATCALRVDFLNPTQTVPGGSEVDTGEDDDCPSGWGWLNPAAIVNVLKCLFIPTDDHWGDLSESFEGSFLDMLLTPITVVTGGVAAIRDGYEYLAGPDFTGVEGGRRNYISCRGPSANVPIGNGDTWLFRPLDICDDGPAKSIAEYVRPFGAFVFLLGSAVAAARIVIRGFGIGAEV